MLALLFSLGGAAAFQDCVVDVDGKLTFANNTGSIGGAVLIMSSQIKLHPYSELTFIGNQAKGIGGAVYVLEYMMDEFTHANNPDCFLAYFNPHLPPSRWKVFVSGELPTYPSPKPTLALTSLLGQNVGLGER